jgi:hypothetical protein
MERIAPVGIGVDQGADLWIMAVLLKELDRVV